MYFQHNQQSAALSFYRETNFLVKQFDIFIEYQQNVMSIISKIENNLFITYRK